MIKTWFQTIFLICISIFVLFACTGSSPLSSEDEEPPAPENLNVMQMGKLIPSQGDTVFAASAWVTPGKGGTLLLVQGPEDFVTHFQNVDDDSVEDEDDDFDLAAFGDKPGIMIKLMVLPNTVESETELSLTLDNQYVDMEFGPHGMVFKRPALLDITATGLKLENANLETIDIYYDNQENGRWEHMEREKLIVNNDTGIVRVVKAKIPHFSRYAIAWSR